MKNRHARRWAGALAAALMCGVGAAGAEPVAVPEAAAIEQADEPIDEVYEDLVGARTAEDKQAAARVLIMRGDETNNAPAAKYALYARAAKFAGEAKDLSTASEALSRIETHFLADMTEARADAAMAAARAARTDTEHAEVATAALAAAQQLMDRERYEEASQLISRVRSSAFRSGRPELVSAYKEMPEAIRVIRAAAEQVAVDRALLAEKPDDPTLNLSVGKFTGLYAGDWPAGLAMLAKGSDEGFAEAARQDLAGPKKGDARAQAGDRWWALAEAAGRGPEADALRDRARHWYTLALPDTKGITRGLLVKRLEPTGGVRWGDLVLEPGLKSALVIDGNADAARDQPPRATPAWRFKQLPRGATKTVVHHFEGYLQSDRAVRVLVDLNTRGTALHLKVNGKLVAAGSGRYDVPVDLIAGYNAFEGWVRVGVPAIQRPDFVPAASIGFKTVDRDKLPVGADSWFHTTK